MCVLKDFGPNKFQNLILSEILENEDICGEDMQSQCNASVSRKKKIQNWQVPLQQTLVISTLFYRGFTKICRYNL